MYHRQFVLAHVVVDNGEVRKIRVKFYDISKEHEAEEMMRDAKSVLLGHPKVFFIYSTLVWYWQDLFNEIVADGGQIVIFNGIVPYDIGYLSDVRKYALEFTSWIVGEDQLAEVEKGFDLYWGAFYAVNGKLSLSFKVTEGKVFMNRS